MLNEASVKSAELFLNAIAEQLVGSRVVVKTTVVILAAAIVNGIRANS